MEIFCSDSAFQIQYKEIVSAIPVKIDLFFDEFNGFRLAGKIHLDRTESKLSFFHTVLLFVFWLYDFLFPVLQYNNSQIFQEENRTFFMYNLTRKMYILTILIYKRIYSTLYITYFTIFLTFFTDNFICIFLLFMLY